MVSVPVRAFAVAASIAADRFGENAADVFDVVPSRARMVAICALIELYPDASHVEIARCFGWQQSGNALSAALTSARVSAWWRASDVERVFSQTRRALFKTPFEDLLHEPLQELSDPRETVYKPRKYTPSRIIHVAASRPGNVTASLLGDPPRGRREELAAMQSPHYSAGNEHGRFHRYRGKRVLEAAE